MKEADIEQRLDWAVQRAGGKTWKFVSPANCGVSDRIVCLPNGDTWFVELKRPGGKRTALQERFAKEMVGLRQKYALLSSAEEVDAWVTSISG